MKKILLGLFLLWPLNSFGQHIIDLGVRRNSTGSPLDSIYCYGVMSDSLVLRGLKADSIRWYRYRGTTFVDSTKNLFGADSIPTNPLGSHWQKGVFRKAFRASNSGGEVGQYTVLAKVYIGSQSSANYEENYIWTYVVVTDPQGDVDTTDFVAAGAIDTNSMSATLKQMFARHTRIGTATGATATTISLDASASATDAYYADQRIYILSGTGVGQDRAIIKYEGALQRVTVDTNWAVNPTGTPVFMVYAASGSPQIQSNYVWNTTANATRTITDNTALTEANLDATISSRMAKTDSSVIRGNIVDQKISVGTGGQVLTVRGIDTVRAGGIDSNSYNNNVKRALLGRLYVGTATAVGGSTVTLATDVVTDSLRGAYITINSATTGANQTRPIATFDGGTRVATVTNPWSPTLTGTVTYTVWRAYGLLGASEIYPEAIGASEVADGAIDNGAIGADALDQTKFNPDYATSAGGGADSGTVARIGKRMWGIALGASGSDSTTVAQRTVSASLQSLGSGPYNIRIFALDSASGAAVQGYTFSIRDSITGTIWAQTFATNASGYVDFASIGSTTYFARGAKALYRFAANADTVLNVLAANFTDTVLVVGITLPSPPVGGQVNLSGNVKAVLGVAIPGASVVFNLERPAYFSTDDTLNMVLVMLEPSIAVTDSLGDWNLNVYPTTKLLSTDRRYPPKYACSVYGPTGLLIMTTPFEITVSHSPGSQLFQYRQWHWKVE